MLLGKRCVVAFIHTIVTQLLNAGEEAFRFRRCVMQEAGRVNNCRAAS